MIERRKYKNPIHIYQILFFYHYVITSIKSIAPLSQIKPALLLLFVRPLRCYPHRPLRLPSFVWHSRTTIIASLKETSDELILLLWDLLVHSDSKFIDCQDTQSHNLRSIAQGQDANGKEKPLLQSQNRLLNLLSIDFRSGHAYLQSGCVRLHASSAHKARGPVFKHLLNRSFRNIAYIRFLARWLVLLLHDQIVQRWKRKINDQSLESEIAKYCVWLLGKSWRKSWLVSYGIRERTTTELSLPDSSIRWSYACLVSHFKETAKHYFRYIVRSSALWRWKAYAAHKNLFSSVDQLKFYGIGLLEQKLILPSGEQRFRSGQPVQWEWAVEIYDLMRVCLRDEIDILDRYSLKFLQIKKIKTLTS